MIRITKGQANTVVVTTTEKGSASYYLFAFQNLTTMDVEYCVAQDTSPYPQRYNTFTITETSSPTATDAEVELSLEGEYKYWIYANSSSSNIDPSGLTVLETGMCTVSGASTSDDTYTNNPTYTVYNG